MAEVGEDQHTCDWCLQDERTVKATQYCFQCANKLCTRCFKSHKRCKPMTNHTLKHIEEYDLDLDAEVFVQNVLKCPKHPLDVVKYICTDHDDACCNECAIVTHRKCDNLVLLSKECGNHEGSGNSTLASLMKLDKQANALLFHENDNQDALSKSEERVINELSEMKNKIHDTFKTLEQNVMSELDKKIKGYRNESDNNRREIEEISTEILSTMRHAKVVSDKSDPVLGYLFERKQCKQTGTFHEKISELVEKTKTRDIQLVRLNSVSEICEMIAGSLKIEEVTSTPKFEFDQSVASDAIPEDNECTQKKFTFEYAADIGTRGFCLNVTCAWIGKYIVVCVRGTDRVLVLYNIDKQILDAEGVLPPDNGSLDTTAIDSNLIGVCYSTKYVDVLNTLQGYFVHKQRIKTNTEVYAISMNKTDNELVCLSYEAKEIEFISLKDQTSKCVYLDASIQVDLLKTHIRISYDNHKRIIYVLGCVKHKVVSFDRTGKKLNELKTTKEVTISDTRDIAVDNESNVYIVKGDSVLQFDKNLKYIRTIINEQEDLQYIAFNENSTKCVLIRGRAPIHLCVYSLK